MAQVKDVLPMNNIYAKLLEAKKEIQVVTKNAVNPFFKNNYADLNAIITAVEEILHTKGLVLLQPIKDGKVFSIIYDTSYRADKAERKERGPLPADIVLHHHQRRSRRPGTGAQDGGQNAGTGPCERVVLRKSGRWPRRRRRQPSVRTHACSGLRLLVGQTEVSTHLRKAIVGGSRKPATIA